MVLTLQYTVNPLINAPVY